MGTPAFVIVDIETSGLDVSKNMILELGILALDRDLNLIDEFQSVVVSDRAIDFLDHLELLAKQEQTYRGQEPWKGAKIVHEMHQKSGLSAEIRGHHAAGIRCDMFDVQASAVEFLRRNYIDAPGGHLRMPMVGSSVHFDRRFLETYMPAVESLFFYRNIDVSTIKGIADVVRADVARERGEVLRPAGRHRALPDCYDTRDELAFYLSRFFSKEATADA